MMWTESKTNIEIKMSVAIGNWEGISKPVNDTIFILVVGVIVIPVRKYKKRKLISSNF